MPGWLSASPLAMQQRKGVGMNQKKKAVPQNGTTSTATTRDDVTTTRTSTATKLERVALHLMENGTQGISALSGLAGLNDLNVRNSIGLLRRDHGVCILDEFFEHQHSGGGVTHLKRYWLADRGEARKAAELVDHKRKQRGAEALSQQKIASYLVNFPINSGHQPAA